LPDDLCLHDCFSETPSDDEGRRTLASPRARGRLRPGVFRRAPRRVSCRRRRDLASSGTVTPMLALARWLGPWADPAARPDAQVYDEDLEGMQVRIYKPARGRHAKQPRRAFLVAPGLHYACADDPRMDRFCRILTTAGHQVIVPYIPDFLALVPTGRAKRDFLRAFDALPRWTSARPVVFSISFGSLLAFALAAERGAALERLIVFGGYADLGETLRFSLTGQVPSGRAAVRDPLNQPVVLMNLLDHLDPPVADRAALALAWRRYVERTWGRAELKLDRRFAAIAQELAPAVPASVRELFLVGTGALPGAEALAMPALARFDATALDPSPYLPRITCRVDLVHGVDDDVIPFEHAHALAAALSSASVRVHLTGMYGHTGAARPPLGAALRELATLTRVLRLLAA
jgi:pimeloyl-ACP methyl ester carboxylesterase